MCSAQSSSHHPKNATRTELHKLQYLHDKAAQYYHSNIFNGFPVHCNKLADSFQLLHWLVLQHRRWLDCLQVSVIDPQWGHASSSTSRGNSLEVLCQYYLNLNYWWWQSIAKITCHQTQTQPIISFQEVAADFCTYGC